jgi:uncharacterized protein (DUF3084 family)
MDNLSRTNQDLSKMSLEYLRALQSQLEDSGEQLLVKLDSILEENKQVRGAVKTLKYEPKALTEAKKIERAKEREERKMQVVEPPQILSEKSDNIGV